MSGTDPSDPARRPPDRRKLIAVFHMDMAGYSRLIGLDDVGTLERLRSLRSSLIDPAIEEHGGRLVNTGGDSLLIVFDSIDGAVRCAVKVQQQVPIHDGGHPADRAIRFRVGINVGDVIPDGTDVHGDVVNVAARLQAECPPGGICVSRQVRDHVHDRFELVFDELGALNLKNIARPVEAFVLKVDVATGQAAVAPTISRSKSDHWAAPRTLLLPEPSLAVLPFTNMSGDPEQEYFADGVVEDIITALSRIGWLFVVARNSSFSYKGKSPDIRAVGRELGVRYVLEGSIRRAGGRVRIASQLIDATTGGHVWADRFEEELVDVFDLQDRISESVAGAIEPNLQRAEIIRATAKPTASLDAYELYLRALPHFYAFNRNGTEIASELLCRALELDANYPRAKALLGWVLVIRISAGWAGADEVSQAIRLAEAVLQANPNDPSALGTAGQVLGYVGSDIDLARWAVNRALSLSPTSAQVLLAAGWVHSSAGDAVAAIDFFQHGIRLSPRDPTMPVFLGGLGMAYLQAGHDEDACESFRRSVLERPNPVPLRGLITALIRLGRSDEARAAAAKLLRLWPEFRVSTVRIPFWNSSFAQEQREACRLAGLPD